MYQTKNMGLNITEMPKDTNMAFSFHTDLGYNFEAIDNLALSHRNITNCILEIPQRIKYTLVDGVLTIKAGTVVTVPNGVGVFEEVTIMNDVTLQPKGRINSDMIFIRQDGSILTETEFQSSGPTQPENTVLWYDTVNNVINKVTVSVVDTSIKFSFPLCKVSYTNGVLTSVDQVFNGFGYMGSTVWVNKGVKGLAPNGRNEYGALNNDSWTASEIAIRTIENNSGYFMLACNPNEPISGYKFGVISHSAFKYDESLNLNFNSNELWGYTPLGSMTLTNGAISNLKFKQHFQVVDHNDFSTKIAELEAKIEALQATLQG